MPHVISKIRERVGLFVDRLRLAPKTYDDARLIAATVGPAKIVRDYQLPRGMKRGEIAARFAREAFPTVAFAAAFMGALDGFRDFEKGRLWD